VEGLAQLRPIAVRKRLHLVPPREAASRALLDTRSVQCPVAVVGAGVAGAAGVTAAQTVSRAAGGSGILLAAAGAAGGVADLLTGLAVIPRPARVATVCVAIGCPAEATVVCWCRLVLQKAGGVVRAIRSAHRDSPAALIGMYVRHRRTGQQRTEAGPTPAEGHVALAAEAGRPWRAGARVTGDCYVAALNLQKGPCGRRECGAGAGKAAARRRKGQARVRDVGAGVGREGRGDPNMQLRPAITRHPPTRVSEFRRRSRSALDVSPVTCPPSMLRTVPAWLPRPRTTRRLLRKPRSGTQLLISTCGRTQRGRGARKAGLADDNNLRSSSGLARNNK